VTNREKSNEEASMSTVLDAPAATDAESAARRLRSTMAAVRVSLSWLGVRKALTPEQRAQAAESFGAEGEFLSAGKKLLDTRDPAFKAVSSVRSRLLAYWKGMTLPYPELGVRLIRQADIAGFDAHMATLRQELADAVERLDNEYDQLKRAARERLGRLYSVADYPQALRSLFGVEWDFPSVEPPDYLRELSPELFEQEQARVVARFDEAVRLAEEAFMSELARCVSHLAERLSGSADGKPKIFRDSAVTNLAEFFERFRTLNVRSSAELDGLVDRVQGLVRGVQPREIREQVPMRQHIAQELSGVQAVLDDLLIDRPRRNILRRPR
jgi:hypothetical protein